MPKEPKCIVSVRPDTIGDLVIYSSAIEAMRTAWPRSCHVLLVRKGYEELAPLLPEWLEWKTFDFNPFRQKPSECRGQLDALCADIGRLDPDLILASALNRTWLEAAIAGRFPQVRSVALGRSETDPIFAAELKLSLGLDSATAFHEKIPADASERDWENQHRLVDRLLGGRGPRPTPRITVPAAAAAQAEAFLAKNKIQPGRWAAVFAGGLANVPVKAWRPDAFGELAAWVEKEQGLPVVLLGHESERAMIEEVAKAARANGGRPLSWLGRDGEIPLLAALLERSRIYLGHDTGAMHLAAALGRPTVGIFGGGHWPRFRPVGRQVAAVVHPLPCFGCGWDCEFGNGPCVKLLAPNDIQQAVADLLKAGDGAMDRVLEVRRLPEEALSLIARVTPQYRALQADRLQRQHRIEELKAETDSKDVEIDDLKRVAEERKAESDAKDLEIADLKQAAEERKAESDAKQVEIADLKQEANSKDAEIADLKKAAEERKAESDSKDAEIADLKSVCNEREALIIQQDGHIKHFQKAIADLNAAIGQREERLAAAEAECERVSAILSRLPPDASTWAEKLSAKDVHIRNIEAALALKEQEAAEKDRSLANYSAGYGNLEQAKRYGRLLAEKEAVIQNLNRACVERQAVIAQLAADATRPTAALRKAALAVRSYFRLKVRDPLSDWLFRKMVEEYWMQIGVLRHYDPRPIAWDRRIRRKPRLPEARLPRMGVVTPSFGQPAYIESTLLSVLNQKYPKLLYVVQDGGSPEVIRRIIERHSGGLRHWESAPDKGQADAVRKGFAKIEAELQAEDVMAWLNSDDFIAPRALRLVAEYFAEHPKVDVVYGHRIIIDDQDREIGRWIMPRHDPSALEWIDYVPQETLFWRKRAWDLVGGIDPTFHFALDWDLLARFQQAGCTIVRLPYFLGCFRLHAEQKTSHSIHTTGAEEMARIRARFHPGREQDFETIQAHARKVRLRGALVARAAALGIRW